MNRIILLICCLSTCLPCLWSQSDEQVLTYDNEYLLDFRFHTNGYFALGFDKSNIHSERLTNFYHFDVGTIKHPKESTNGNRIIPPSANYEVRPYSFGKQNSFFLLRGGYGQKRFFSDENTEIGMKLAFVYEGGLSLGILKPYYLDLIVGTTGEQYQIVGTPYTEKYATEFTDVNFILGHSGSKYGWDELSTIFGGHLQGGLHIDWDASSDIIKALEVGFMLDVFQKKVPILLTEKNQQVFMNVYVSLLFGKRS